MTGRLCRSSICYQSRRPPRASGSMAGAFSSLGRTSFAAHKLRREHAIEDTALVEVKVYREAGRPPKTQKQEGRMKIIAIAIAKQKGGRK